MEAINTLSKQSTKHEIFEVLLALFRPYATELINSGADFSYMNMYADNFKDALQANTSLNDFEIFEILNDACDKSWKSQT